MYYRVRKSWEDTKSQIGAYTILQNAINKCSENPGYSVFDEDGKVLYTAGSEWVKSMGYNVTLKKKVSKRYPKGKKTTVERNLKKEWVLPDGTVVPNRKDYLDLTKQLYNPNAKYTKADAENFVNKNGYSSKTDWLFWCSKWCQKVYIFKGKKGAWVLEKVYKCGTGNIKYGDPSDQGIGFKWKIYDKHKTFQGPRGTLYYCMHYSSPYGNAIHKGTTGKPSTHGCIALGNSAAKWAFENLPVGTKVIVY